MEEKIILWGAVSVRALRAQWALHELNLSYEFKPIQSRTGETLTAEYTGHNPKQKIPCLQDGRFTLTESAAIVHYLFRAYGEGRGVFMPKTAQESAQLDEWSYFAMMELDATLYTIRLHKYLSEIYGESPVAVEAAKKYCLKQITSMDTKIAKADPYLFGDDISAADILLGTTLDFAERFEVAIPDRCRAYRDRALARPAFKAAKTRNESLND